MKKSYQQPVARILSFACEELILASGGGENSFMDSLVESGQIGGYDGVVSSDYTNWADE